MGALRIVHLVAACRPVSNIMKVCLVLSCLLALSAAVPAANFRRLVQPRNDLTCNLCVTLLTQLDDFITSDTTEGEIVEFVEQICSALGSLGIPSCQPNRIERLGNIWG